MQFYNNKCQVGSWKEKHGGGLHHQEQWVLKHKIAICSRNTMQKKNKKNCLVKDYTLNTTTNILKQNQFSTFEP